MVVVLGYCVYDYKIMSSKDAINLTGNTIVTEPEIAPDYFYVPEWKIRFTKVDGLDVTYSIKDGYLHFSLTKINSLAQTDKDIKDCADQGAYLITTISKDQTDYQGYYQVKLADGRYLNTYGPQAVCYNPRAKAENIEILKEQSNLLPKFVNSVQSY